MPTFEYQALDSMGKKSRGSIAAESASVARRLLRHRNIHATRLRPIGEAVHARGYKFGGFFRARRRREVLEFTRQLGTMVEADIKLTEALGVLSVQAQNNKLGQIIQNIRDQVVAGETMVDGLKQYPEWFDPIYVAMVRVGEVTGNLGRTLKLLADYLAKRLRLETKIKSALTYPAFLVVVCVIVIIILMTFVVPKITNIITASGRTIPASTKLLMGVSAMFVNWWWAMLLVLALLWFLLRRGVATPRGKLIFDRLILQLPVLGKILRQNVVARFTSTLATLIRSGLPVADGLQTVAEVTGNALVTEAIRRCRERIIAGADISTPLRESKVVDPAVAHMIAVGERTGELETMLQTIADSMEENADISIQRISSVIEPCVIVVMAVIVGFIMFATLMPILEVPNLTGL